MKASKPSERLTLGPAVASVLMAVLAAIVCCKRSLFHDGHHDISGDKATIMRQQPTNNMGNAACPDSRYHLSGNSNSLHRTIGWEFAGPTGYVFGPEPRLAAAAAVQNIVKGGTIRNSVSSNDNTKSNATQTTTTFWFMSSVNGGVWRTSNLQDARPHWVNVLDHKNQQQYLQKNNNNDGNRPLCTSISALHYATATGFVYAGCGGATSSEQGWDWNVVNSGDWGGLLVSKDNGDTWARMTAFPVNYYITDILTIRTSSDNNGILLVAAQSHLYNRDDGGIWRSADQGKTFHKVHNVPTFGLKHLPSIKAILANHARNTSHAMAWSTNFGVSFESSSSRDVLPWDPGMVPFYTCVAFMGNGRLVFGALTRLTGGEPDDTDSQIFITKDPVDQHFRLDDDSNNNTLSTFEWLSMDQPTSMDEDSMPKDRMALLADPQLSDLLYVAGNAGALAWRVNVTTDQWQTLWDEPDISDGSIPHGDCRNYAWDDDSQRLLLVSDGGLFARHGPRAPGGQWVSLNGDYSALELLSAHYDPRQDRYVMGAQDNCAIVTKANATPGDLAYGFVEGDGAITLVDSSRTNVSRLFGTTQFLGVGTIENDPHAKRRKSYSRQDDDDDDDDCGGLCFVEGDRRIGVPVTEYISEPSSFPFFVHPYTLNQQDPTKLQFWTNGTLHRPSAIYEFHIPYTVKDDDDIPPPKVVLKTPPGAMILDFVSGGQTDGQPDSNLIVAISTTHLFVQNRLEGKYGPGKGLLQRSLPVSFAAPVTLVYDEDGERILGPLTHARTLSMTVSPSDSRWIAVTGWPSVENNEGDEAVFLTMDAGKTWHNVTQNLRSASGVVGKVRPGGLLFVELDHDGRRQQGTVPTRALLVGTSSGILVTFLTPSRTNNTDVSGVTSTCWLRLGSYEEFPVVLTSDVDYEPISDRLVAATFGRGIFVLKNAKERLARMRLWFRSSQAVV